MHVAEGYFFSFLWLRLVTVGGFELVELLSMTFYKTLTYSVGPLFHFNLSRAISWEQFIVNWKWKQTVHNIPKTIAWHHNRVARKKPRENHNVAREKTVSCCSSSKGKKIPGPQPLLTVLSKCFPVEWYSRFSFAFF